MATYTSYEQVGIKEDVSDIITDITPTDTPFVSAIKTQKVNNRTYQYQTDALAAAGANAQIEGADPTMATLTPTTMISGTTQILTKALTLRAAA